MAEGVTVFVGDDSVTIEVQEFRVSGLGLGLSRIGFSVLYDAGPFITEYGGEGLPFLHHGVLHVVVTSVRAYGVVGGRFNGHHGIAVVGKVEGGLPGEVLCVKHVVLCEELHAAVSDGTVVALLGLEADGCH